MTRPIEPGIKAVILVDQNGNCLPPVPVAGTDICSNPEFPVTRPILVDPEGKIITSKSRVGDGAAILMTPALPDAGVESVGGTFQQSGFEDFVVSVFADQPGKLFIEEDYTGLGTFRRTAALLVTQANELVSGIFVASRAFFRVVWKNDGGATVTTLEVTITRRGNCSVPGGTITTIGV